MIDESKKEKMKLNNFDIMTYGEQFAGTQIPKERNEYLKRFYKALSDGVKANLRREYYDRIIADFSIDKKLSTEQMQDIDNWQKYSFLEKEYISKSKSILHEFNSVFNIRSSVPDYENVLFDLAFIIEKRNQHIEKFKRIVQNYKSKNVAKYEQGLIILKNLNEEYNIKIKEGMNNAYFK